MLLRPASSRAWPGTHLQARDSRAPLAPARQQQRAKPGRQLQQQQQQRQVRSQRRAMADSGSAVAAAAPAAAAAAAPPSPQQAIEFLTLLERLKVSLGGGLAWRATLQAAGAESPPPRRAQAQKRTGWVKRGVQGPESIADHMYRMGLMAMLVQGTQYNYQRCAAPPCARPPRPGALVPWTPAA